MLCGACALALAGCGDPTLYATYEAPANLPEGVVDLQFHTHSSMEEDGTVYYDLLTFNYGTQNDVYIEIFVEPQYTVQEVTLRIEAEDGSWTEETSELEEAYLIYEEHPNTQLKGVDCMRYRTKPMKSFAGKTAMRCMRTFLPFQAAQRQRRTAACSLEMLSYAPNFPLHNPLPGADQRPGSRRG